MKSKLLHVISLAALMTLSACGQTTSSVNPSSSAEGSSSVTESTVVDTSSTVESTVADSSVKVTTYAVTGSATVDIGTKNVTTYATFAYTGSTSGAGTAFAAGETVTVVVTPIEHYAIKEVTALAGENPVELTKGENNSYTFTMPSAEIEVSAELVRVADYTLDCSTLVESEDKKTISDNTFTVHRKSDASDADKTTVDGSTVKLSGNTEFGSKLGKLVSFKATAPGRVYVKWKSGTSNETERCGYLIQATEDSNIGKTMGYRNFAVSEEDGKALWSEDIFAFPTAGTYYLAGNAAYAIGGFKLYYDSTVTAEDVITYTELGEDPDVLNGTLAIPTDNAGYTAEHKIGNYTFGVGVVAKFYGKITGDTPIAYSCFELSDGEEMKFTASAPGTLSLRVTARSGAVDNVYPTSRLIASDETASTIAVTGIPEDGMISSSKTKTWYNLSVQFTQAGEYTFTAENVVDIYSAKFSAIA